MITINDPIVNSDTILQYIPQRPPIVLISRIYKCDEASVITGFDIIDEHMLIQNGKLTESGIIENMAQTAASMAGYEAVINNSPPRVGFIANVKNLVINYLPESGNEILTEVKTKTQVMNVSIIEASSYCNNKLVATCEMKIFLQENA
ncbi:MAG: 3-hydroxyacyl-ACP dehydratase [Bacteroidetes bacterium]|jgi:predicted hotdog family 3-hydroxylacyl-ACP dehydratase|nr:3-hydroxyacyl-ACP dehydratase [Bacteroidota bacterium]